MNNWTAKISEAENDIYWVARDLARKAECFKETGNIHMSDFLTMQSTILNRIASTIKEANDTAFTDWLNASTNSNILNSVLAGIKLAGNPKVNKL